MMPDRRWARSEFFSLSTLLLVLGWIVWASQRVSKWDVVIDPHMGNAALNDRVTIVETNDKDFKEQVLRELNAIYKKVK